jgi:hypothetical protein
VCCYCVSYFVLLFSFCTASSTIAFTSFLLILVFSLVFCLLRCVGFVFDRSASENEYDSVHLFRVFGCVCCDVCGSEYSSVFVARLRMNLACVRVVSDMFCFFGMGFRLMFVGIAWRGLSSWKFFAYSCSEQLLAISFFVIFMFFVRILRLPACSS